MSSKRAVIHHARSSTAASSRARVAVIRMTRDGAESRRACCISSPDRPAEFLSVTMKVTGDSRRRSVPPRRSPPLDDLRHSAPRIRSRNTMRMMVSSSHHEQPLAWARGHLGRGENHAEHGGWRAARRAALREGRVDARVVLLRDAPRRRASPVPRLLTVTYSSKIFSRGSSRCRGPSPPRTARATGPRW